MKEFIQFVLGCAVLGACVWSAVWAYKDADRRGKPPLLVAALIVLIAWPVSLLVWIALRPERRSFDTQDARTERLRRAARSFPKN
jgi:hypothetical protein